VGKGLLFFHREKPFFILLMCYNGNNFLQGFPVTAGRQVYFEEERI